MKRLRCTNKECCSRSGEVPSFSVNVRVDEDGKVDETIKHIEGECFTCNFCHSLAEWKKTPKVGDDVVVDDKEWSWQGTIVASKDEDGLFAVEDQDGDVWDVESDKVEVA